jgi:DNA-binding CsgD family transcriptional regulator
LKHVRIQQGDHAAVGNENSPPGWELAPHGRVVHTAADLMRRCRWIAGDIGATGFAAFFLNAAPGRARLVPCFDCHYPGMASLADAVADSTPGGVEHHALVATEPCWWADDEASCLATSCGRLNWATRQPSPEQGGCGIALPVHADRGRSGLIMFLGSDIEMSQRALLDVHARCFSIFSALCRIRPADDGGTGTISRRELECLKLTANGCTSEEIARLLKLSVHTANQYLTQSAQKLNAVNRTQAVAKALRLGLIE